MESIEIMKEADNFIEISDKIKEMLNNIEDTSNIDTNDVYHLMMIRKKINREIKNKVNNKEIYESYTSILMEIDLALSVIDIEKIKENELKQNKAIKNKYKKLRDYKYESQVWEYTVDFLVNAVVKTCVSIFLLMCIIIVPLKEFGIISASVGIALYNKIGILVLWVLVSAIIGIIARFALSKRMNYKKASEYDQMNKAKFIYNNMYALFVKNNIHGKELNINNKNINNQLIAFKERFCNAKTLEDEIKTCVDVEYFYENNKERFGKKIVKLIET